jgi:cell division protein ZapD
MSGERASRQASLFADSGAPVIYELPLNERVRNCLRLEHLFAGIEAGIQGATEWDARNALGRMLEVGDFLVRTDMKGEMMKELERNLSAFNGLRNNPGVDPGALDHTIGTISDVLGLLKSPDFQPGTRLRGDELANQVRQRLSIPGGTCSFDVPALHFWLNSDPALRAAHLQAWMQDLRGVERAIRLILRLIRESSNPRTAIAPSGFYQQQLEGNSTCQIVRVVMPFAADVYPEISGGKHRFTVRFYTQRQTGTRPVQAADDITFELHCCGI